MWISADLVNLSERIDTTSAAGKMLFRLLAVLNEFEREKISEWTRQGLDHKRSKGEFCGGRVPFGFDEEDGKLKPNLPEQNAIALMIERRASGWTLAAICAELEKRGIRTRTGVGWSPTTVWRILRRAA